MAVFDIDTSNKRDGREYGQNLIRRLPKGVVSCTRTQTDAFKIALEITDDECDDEQQQQQPDQATTAVTSDNTTVTSAQSVGDTCLVCLMALRDYVALVPCGHSRFCGACTATTVATMDNGCPVCRTRIDMVLRLYN